MRRLKCKEGSGGAGHPELEQVAAFIDGRLAAAERARVAEHLHSCADCFELYTGALQCVQQNVAQPVVVPFRTRQAGIWRPALAALAAALLLVLGFSAYHAFYARPEMEVADLVQTLRVSDGLGQLVWTGDTLRSAGDEEDDADPGALSFLAGAHLVGFQASLEAGDPQAASAAARRVANVLDEGGFLDGAVREFRAAQHALGNRGAAGRFEHLVEETSPAIEDALLPVHLDFGKWAQAGYVAARSQSRAFFERRANRRFLAWLLEEDEEGIDREALAQLRLVDRIWRRDPLRPEDFQLLKRAFSGILDRYETLARVEPSFF